MRHSSQTISLLVLALATTAFASANLRKVSDKNTCLDCADLCALIPPDDKQDKFPCYQGSPKDANKCYNTDPLLPDGATASCGRCSDFGFGYYLQNDPLYKNMELWLKEKANKHGGRVGDENDDDAIHSDACLECTSSCALLPPADSNFPCYQGTPEDSNFCYNTDPLLPSGGSYSCGVCSDFGYDTYLQNDPIYTNMELWSSMPSRKETEIDASVCMECSTSCSLVPPENLADKFPCYQGKPSDANKCYNTDPLLPDGMVPHCGYCQDFGFENFLQNDPLYTNMELWNKGSQSTTA